MKKLTKIISLCVMVALLVSTLAACGLSEAEAVGTWSGTYTYNGNDFSVAIVLESDGSYAKVTMKNGMLSSSETGDYEIKGNKVTLYDSDSIVYHGKSITYKYKNGALVNNDHYFYKN